MSEPFWVPLGGGPAQVEQEAAYGEITDPVGVTGADEAGASVVVTAPPLTCDGATAYLVEFYTPRLDGQSMQAPGPGFALFQDGVSVGIMGLHSPSPNAGAEGNNFWTPLYLVRRIVPPAGVHTFSIRGYHTGSNASTVYAGPGGAGTYPPAFIRVSRAASQVVLPPKSDDRIRGISQGFKGEAFHRAAIQAAQIITTGVAQAVAVPLRAGDVVTNLIVGASVAGSGQTLVKMGLYDGASPANRLAVSADQKALFTGGSYPRGIVVPMLATYTAPDDMTAYIVLLGVGGTQPTVLRGVNLAASSFQIGTARQSHWQANASDLGATLTPAQSGIGIWAGWS